MNEWMSWKFEIWYVLEYSCCWQVVDERYIWEKERGRKEKQDREGMGNIYKVDTATKKKKEKTDG